MIYLDHAATSYPKPEPVISAMSVALRDAGANPGRGGHKLAQRANRLILEARDAVRDFFDADDYHVIWTKNATESINLALKGYLTSGCQVVTTSVEHNAVMRPLEALKISSGIRVSLAEADTQGFTDVHNFISLLEGASFAVMTTASNVNGALQPYQKVVEACQALGVPVLLDASQTAGVVPLSLKSCPADFVAMPGHKGLLGPQGTGILLVRKKYHLSPLLQGGTGTQSESFLQPTDAPDSLESGTLNLPGIAGVMQGIRWIQSGQSHSYEEKQTLMDMLRNLVIPLKHIQIHSPHAQNAGVFAFGFEGIDPGELAHVLDEGYDIAVRSGLQCAPSAHRLLGTLPAGCVRASIGWNTSPEDILAFAAALTEIDNFIESQA